MYLHLETQIRLSLVKNLRDGIVTRRDIASGLTSGKLTAILARYFPYHSSIRYYSHGHGHGANAHPNAWLNILVKAQDKSYLPHQWRFKSLPVLPHHRSRPRRFHQGH